MKYSVEDWIFEKVPQIEFGILIVHGLKNRPSSEIEDEALKQSEQWVRDHIELERIKTSEGLIDYRTALKAVGINANKYMNSVEAMTKRVVKGGYLPRINAFVDTCNAISLRHQISLGGHDLRDIHHDLSVRRSLEDDCFLPFGETERERLGEGEVVFTSGHEVQTRQWFWRQSELGKMDLETQDIVFQLVGFKGEHYDAFESAIEAVKQFVEAEGCDSVACFRVNQNQKCIHFD